MNSLLGAMPGFAVQILFFFLALFPLVLIHELGHFLLAKMNDVRVDEFGIGFPPRLMKVFSAGGTDYTLNALPLGGFVRLAGEDDPTIPGAFASKSKRARAAVLFAGPLANFLLAAVILSCIAFFIGAASAVPQSGGMVQLILVSPDSAAEAGGLENEDIVAAIDGESLLSLPIERELAEGEYYAAQSLIEAVDAHAGETMQVTALRGVDAVQVTRGLAEAQTEAFPALDAISGMDAARVTMASGDLRAGDIIVELDALADTPVVLRGDLEIVDVTVSPVFDAEAGRGLMGVQIGALTVSERLGMVESLKFGPDRTIFLMGAMVDGLYQMITGQLEADIAGPVGISKMSREYGERGLADFLGFMALLSINLGIINLFPIPALDGGRLLFILLEALRGRRIEPAREAVVHLIGFALVIGLMVVITVYEVFGGIGAP